MPHQFKHHYTSAEAAALLPQIRQWLNQLRQLHPRLANRDERLRQLLARGYEVGGPLANEWMRLITEIQAIFDEFKRRELLIKDLDRGLVDFPAIIGGREVFLCWEEGEDTVEFWHELKIGRASCRERVLRLV